MTVSPPAVITFDLASPVPCRSENPVREIGEAGRRAAVADVIGQNHPRAVRAGNRVQNTSQPALAIRISAVPGQTGPNLLPYPAFVLPWGLAVAENQPTTKNRMTSEHSSFAARLRAAILSEGRVTRVPDSELQELNGDSCNSSLRGDATFNTLALELFALQFQHNTAYRKISEARGQTPRTIEHWTQIPAVPTAAFKEMELTCLAPSERTAVFHSSGTTEQKPSRHFHHAESLKVYEALLWPWFAQNVLPDFRFPISDFRLLCLTPPPEQAPHSSLIHMFEIVRRRLDAPESAFVGKIGADGIWVLDFDAALASLEADSKLKTQNSKLILGTAFSLVHLLDYLAEHNLRHQLPAGSRVMETGGYKNRSRLMPKAELHALITKWLGVPGENIICEYGMSELSSQAYAVTSDKWQVTRDAVSSRHLSPVTCHFAFPPWARVQIVSPESGREVADGETGLIRVYDLANVFSIMAVQTEDLGVRRGDGFELIGRARFAEPRGCSLMSA